MPPPRAVELVADLEAQQAAADLWAHEQHQRLNQALDQVECDNAKTVTSIEPAVVAQRRIVHHDRVLHDHPIFDATARSFRSELPLITGTVQGRSPSYDTDDSDDDDAAVAEENDNSANEREQQQYALRTRRAMQPLLKPVVAAIGVESPAPIFEEHLSSDDDEAEQQQQSFDVSPLVKPRRLRRLHEPLPVAMARDIERCANESDQADDDRDDTDQDDRRSFASERSREPPRPVVTHRRLHRSVLSPVLQLVDRESASLSTATSSAQSSPTPPSAPQQPPLPEPPLHRRSLRPLLFPPRDAVAAVTVPSPSRLPLLRTIGFVDSRGHSERYALVAESEYIAWPTGAMQHSCPRKQPDLSCNHDNDAPTTPYQYRMSAQSIREALIASSVRLRQVAPCHHSTARICLTPPYSVCVRDGVCRWPEGCCEPHGGIGTNARLRTSERTIDRVPPCQYLLHSEEDVVGRYCRCYYNDALQA